MNEPEPNESFADQFREVVQSQTRLLDALIQLLSDRLDEPINEDQEAVIRVTILMIQAFGVSVHSVLKLTEEPDMGIRDCFGIARSATELAVNICYIAAAGRTAAGRAERHAFQKSYRDLKRSGSVGGFTLKIERTSLPRIDEIPGLSDAMAEFTGSRGQELSSWTPLNISSRIDAVRHICENSALCLAGATTSVYRHSSEILHGTYFGVVHFWSASGSRATTRTRFNEVWREHLTTILTGVFFAAQGIVVLFDQLFTCEPISVAQRDLNGRMSALIAADQGAS
jgi:hypothetical protein